ncbi:DUF2066 domain-containing protein [Rhodomicrobium sp. Az07]|uniref:DUF2066 domain-containing protein n=1 Tax=Rhodomicrobium sp. Az07 TaxID=2839034 RepID=UPI001BE7E399|nr:DUF2066 domain-containing protein [Rhodomicrobium sp. Az07]MBT3070609.1 DUF2066 domain-containing protein [Rhodomicrobium sp. Az07]
MAMKRALTKAGALIALACFGLGLTAAEGIAQTRPASVFAVSNVKVSAEAENAVEAKKIALGQAQSRAFRKLVSRIVDYRSQSHIPDLALNEIEALVSDMDVRGEGVSGTRYVATFGVSFSERAVQALLARYGVAAITDRGPEILIVPVYVEGGAARTADRNAWRMALTSLDLTHALVPAKVAPARSDITAAIASAYIASPAATLETLKTQYRTQQIMFALAETEGDGETISLKLIGLDSGGQFTVQRKVKGRGAGEGTALDAAADLAFDTVQERWKLAREASAPATPDGYGGTAPGPYDGNSAPAYAGSMETLQVTALYAGLKEWQTIRRQLQGLPGVQNWDLRSVNPRSASIAFDFPGGAARLTAMAAGQGLDVENGPDGLVVKVR